MTVTVGTNSYGDETGLAAYAAARGVTIVGNSSQLLIKAMDYLETRRWVGDKYLTTQALEHPRSLLVSTDDTLGSVPARIITAQYMAALLIDGGALLGSSSPRQVTRESIGRGAIEREYAPGSAATTTYPQLTALIGRYLASGGGGFVVSRG